MFLQTGLLFSGKGGYLTTGNFLFGSATTTRLWYIQLPANIGAKIKLDKKITAIAGGGLYASAGISGTEKGVLYGDLTNNQVNNKVYFTNNKSYYKANTTAIRPFDFGYNVLAGIELKKFQFTFNYSHGFSNIYPADDNWDFKNQVFNFSVAYLFSLKPKK